MMVLGGVGGVGGIEHGVEGTQQRVFLNTPNHMGSEREKHVPVKCGDDSSQNGRCVDLGLHHILDTF